MLRAIVMLIIFLYISKFLKAHLNSVFINPSKNLKIKSIGLLV